MLNRRIMKAALVIEERSIARAEEQKLKQMYNNNITLATLTKSLTSVMFC